MTSQSTPVSDREIVALADLLSRRSQGEDPVICQRVADEIGIGDRYRSAAAIAPPPSGRGGRRLASVEQFNAEVHDRMKRGPTGRDDIARRLAQRVTGTGENK